MNWSKDDNKRARHEGWQISNGALFRALDPFRKDVYVFTSVSDAYLHILAKAPKSDFHHRAYMLLPWMSVDKINARKEGWQLSTDGMHIFSVNSNYSDEEMFEGVRNKASQGSPMHIKALNIYARRHLTQDSSSNGHRTHY